MVVEAKTKRHIVDVEEVHKLGGHYRGVHSSTDFYSPSWTYIGLDFSPNFADFAMEGFCSPSLTCMP